MQIEPGTFYPVQGRVSTARVTTTLHGDVSGDNTSKEAMGKKHGAETLGHPLDHGDCSTSFNNAKQFIFVRHGEKPPKDKDGHDSSDHLSPQGFFRADHLHMIFGRDNKQSGYNTPDVIYAMKSKPKTDASKRPFETVKPLAVELGMTPEVGVRTPETGGVNVFDNRFKVDKHKELKDDLIERCGTGEYNDKTILFCWEHKNIPYIVAKLGFSGKKDLTWGLNPESGEDEDNFTAIWVFTPTQDGLDFKVYQEFEIASVSNDAKGPFSVEKPKGGYDKEVYSHGA